MRASREPSQSRSRPSRERRSRDAKKASAYRVRASGCELCGNTRGELGRIHVHHVMPFAEGGACADTNFLALCGSCHDWCHALTALTTNHVPMLWRQIMRALRLDRVRFALAFRAVVLFDKPAGVTQSDPESITRYLNALLPEPLTVTAMAYYTQPLDEHFIERRGMGRADQGLPS